MATSGYRQPPGGAPRPGGQPTPLRGPLLIGVGLAGTADQVVLHQLLGWHHLYDGGGLSAGLVSDGIFHVLSTVLLVLGVVVTLRSRDRRGLRRRRIAGGVLVGAGGFNLYDGTIQHKVLHLHEVRRGVDPLPYDAAFIGVAALLLLGGFVLLRRGGSHRH